MKRCDWIKMDFQTTSVDDAIVIYDHCASVYRIPPPEGYSPPIP
jgi:hypothetical protein